MRRFLSLLVVVLAASIVAAAAAKKPADHGLFNPNQISWTDAPNALPAGAKLAVLEGDPFKSGLYTMRLSVPTGYKIPPHFHKKFEHVTVISGAFNLGMGDKFDTQRQRRCPSEPLVFCRQA